MKSAPLLRAVRILLVLLCAFSTAYVLATPDPTDDVPCVLRANDRPGQAQKLAVFSVRPPTRQESVFPLPSPERYALPLNVFAFPRSRLRIYRC